MSFSDYDSAGTHRFSFTLDGIETKSIKSVEGLEAQAGQGRDQVRDS